VLKCATQQKFHSVTIARYKKSKKQKPARFCDGLVSY
jgi:hypothetical protein